MRTAIELIGVVIWGVCSLLLMCALYFAFWGVLLGGLAASVYWVFKFLTGG